MIAVFQFAVFDEDIKERAKAIAWKFPGVIDLLEGERELAVMGEFSPFGLTKKLKKIDESAEIIYLVPNEVREPKAKTPQQSKSKMPEFDFASSSKGRGVPKFEPLEKVKGIAMQGMYMAFGAVVKGIDKGMELWQNENKEKEEKQKKENVRKIEKIFQEMMGKQQGGTTQGSSSRGTLEGFSDYLSTLPTEQINALLEALLRQASALTEIQGLTQRREDESRGVGKKGKSHK